MPQDFRTQFKKRKADKEKAEKKRLAAVRVQALSETQRRRRDAGIARRAEIREARLAKEAAETAARQAEAKRRRAEEAMAERERALAQQKEAAEEIKKNLDAPAAAKRVTGTRPTRASVPKSLDVMPTLDQLRKEALDVAAMPSIGTLSCALQTSVVYADSMGISAWGDDAGVWAHPSGWMRLVEYFNQVYRHPGTEPSWCDEVVNGEYNAVFVGKKDARMLSTYGLPPLRDRNGSDVGLGDVVFRVTRPDTDYTEKGSKYYRYKRLENLQREVYFTLHGAVNGFAPECYAALLFPAMTVQSKTGPVQLYGTLYVMRRAQIDLGNLLDDHADSTGSRVDPHSMQYVESLRRSGRRVAVKMLPVLYRQSRLGVLSFDAKPGNYVFGTDSKPYAIDFDSAMYSVATGSYRYWEANLLMNLTLLTAHVRCYRHPALADGWASAVRELMIELCTHSRGEVWLQQARADTDRKFKEMTIKDPETQRLCLEMVATAYFVKPRGTVVTPFKAVTGKQASPLMHQLVRYCLHGSIKRVDGPVDRALGNGSAFVAGL